MNNLTMEARMTALQLSRMFQSLPVDDLSKLAAFVEYRAVEKGVYLFREGEKSEGFFLVQSGAINIHRIGPDGREKVIYIFREGESFAEATLADHTGYPAHAQVLENSNVLFIPREPFLQLIRERPEFAMRILASMSQHLRSLVNTLDNMANRDLETRFAYWLLQRCPQPRSEKPVIIALDISKASLAAELHVRQETLSRLLQRSKSAGLIESSGRTIVVNNPLAMEALMHDRMNS